MTGSTPQVTVLLQAWGNGDSEALHQLIPLVHEELRRSARNYMRREGPGHSLQTNALVNEVYLRLVDISRVRWQDRAHFFAIASSLMRRVLLDAARARAAKKRGGGEVRISFAEDLRLADAPASRQASWLIALDDALAALAQTDPRKARVVEMRFFGGLSVEEMAEVLGISPQSVKRDWKLARAWLHKEIAGAPAP